LAAMGGMLWGAASLAAGIVYEAWVCAMFGSGFLLLLAGSRWPSIRFGVAGGIVVAAIPSVYWANSVLQAGTLESPWFLFGIGMVVAAAAALLGTLRPSSHTARIGLPVGFSIAALATLVMLVQNVPRGSPWIIAEFVVLAGLLLLALQAKELPGSPLSRARNNGSAID
jgi:hypothetical protein